MRTIPELKEGTHRAKASGTLPNGKPVIVNADGTVSVVAGTSGSTGTEVQFEAVEVAGSGGPVTIKVDTNKVLVVWAKSNEHGTAVVGTVSGTSISFGSESSFESVGMGQQSAVLVENNKVAICWTQAGSPFNGYALIATVSGTSVSFGSTTLITSNRLKNNAIGLVDTDKVVVAWNNDGNSDYGTAAVGTISGNSISFGGTTVFESAGGDSNVVSAIGSSKVIISYKDTGNSSYGTAIVGTVSGTSISFGSADTFSSAATTHVSGASLGTSGNVVLSYNSSTGSGGSYHSYMQSIVATASGTSISFGTPVTWLDPGVGGGAAIAYGTSTVLLKDNTFVTAFSQASDTDSKLITGTVSGTSITMDTSNIVTYSTSNTADRGVAVVDSDRICIAFRDIGDSNKGNSLVNRFDSTNLTSENYIGMSQGVVTYDFVNQVIGTPAVFFSSEARSPKIAYDTNSNRIVIIYQDFGGGRDGFAVVGTVANNTATFGTPVEFASAYAERNGDIIFDPDTNKVVISYGGGSNYGTAIIGTVNPSDNSITYGTPVVFNSSATNYSRMSYDTVNNKVVIAYNNNSEGSAIVGTVSGTAISFGTEANFNGNTAFSTPVYDIASGKTVVFYRDQAGSNYGNSRVGTVSGTNISFGTEASFASATTNVLTAVYDPTAQKIVVAFRDDGNSNKGTYCVGTVSGTDISFSTEVVFVDFEISQIGAVYDATTSKLVFTYKGGTPNNVGLAISGKLSGTTVTFGTQFTYESGEVGSFQVNPAYDPDNGQVVFPYRDDSDSNKGKVCVVTIGYDDTIIGQVASGSSGTVDIIGSVSTNQSGLTAGQSYYVQTDGTIGETAADPSVFAGTAISATSLVVKT